MTGGAYINIPINKWKVKQDIQTSNKVVCTETTQSLLEYLKFESIT